MNVAEKLGVEVVQVFDREVVVQFVVSKEIRVVPIDWFEQLQPVDMTESSNIISIRRGRVSHGKEAKKQTSKRGA